MTSIAAASLRLSRRWKLNPLLQCNPQHTKLRQRHCGVVAAVRRRGDDDFAGEAAAAQVAAFLTCSDACRARTNEAGLVQRSPRRCRGSAFLPAEPAPALHAIQQDIGDCTRLPAGVCGPAQDRIRGRLAQRAADVCGGRPGRGRGCAGTALCRQGRTVAEQHDWRHGAEARSEVYIANIVKCRPPGNRVPEPVEANTCSQFLLRQIDVVRPEVIVALGSTAAIYLLGVKRSLSTLRGHWYTCRGAKLVVTYHPAFLLRDPRQKGEGVEGPADGDGRDGTDAASAQIGSVLRDDHERA